MVLGADYNLPWLYISLGHFQGDLFTGHLATTFLLSDQHFWNCLDSENQPSHSIMHNTQLSNYTSHITFDSFLDATVISCNAIIFFINKSTVTHSLTADL